MNTAPEQTAAPWRHLRASLPDAAQIREFLARGAVMAWSEDLWIIAWGEAQKSSSPHATKPSFYAPDFFLRDKKPWRIYPEVSAVSPDGLAQLLSRQETKRAWRPFNEAKFAVAFAKVMHAFGDGRLRKADPAEFETSPGALTADERERALRAAANLPSGLMPYGFWDENGGMIGASPELLFEDDGVE
ncbi:MAG: hypothetical protein ACKOFH_02010, partial [Chthoniobacterales bacterium]